jgi:hypothetical protein
VARRLRANHSQIPATDKLRLQHAYPRLRAMD